jgi:hypothetical protein
MAVDADRWGGTWRAVGAQCEPAVDHRMTIDGVDVTWGVGPSPLGSLFRSSFGATTAPVGRPAAPLAAKVWAEWNARFALGLAPRSAAPEVRPR